MIRSTLRSMIVCVSFLFTAAGLARAESVYSQCMAAGDRANSDAVRDARSTCEGEFGYSLCVWIKTQQWTKDYQCSCRDCAAKHGESLFGGSALSALDFCWSKTSDLPPGYTCPAPGGASSVGQSSYSGTISTQQFIASQQVCD